MLSTNDLRLLTEKLLNPPYFDLEAVKRDLQLDDEYVRFLRDGLLNMVNKLETTGEFEIEIPDEVIEHMKQHEQEKGNCDCG